MNKPKLAVSSCLLGKKVRSNGDAAEFRPLNRTWSEHLELIEVCPEVGIGMGVPRPTPRLVEDEERISLIDPMNGHDYTDKMLEYAEVQSDFLVASGISGFVFKTDSPSCGLEKVKVYRGDNPQAVRDGTGLFAKVFTTLYPHIPAAEESQLRDKSQADHFLARVNLLHIWQMFGSEGWTAEKIEAFHLEQKPLMQKMAPNSPLCFPLCFPLCSPLCFPLCCFLALSATRPVGMRRPKAGAVGTGSTKSGPGVWRPRQSATVFPRAG